METNDGNVGDLTGGGTSQGGTQPPANNPGGKSDSSGGNPPVTKLKLSDGREFTPEQLLQEHEKLHSFSTRQAQELKQLKEKATTTPPNGSADLTDPKDVALASELKRLGFVRRTDVDEIVTTKGKEIGSSSATQAITAVQLDGQVREVTSQFNGAKDESVGMEKPKVERKEILDWYISHPGVNLSPLEVARSLHYDAFVKYDAARLNAGKPAAALPQTEASGVGGANANPPGKPVLRFNDGSAERAARELLGG